MGEPSNFVIRRTDRHEIMLPVRLRVHETDQGKVKLSSRSEQRDGWVTADLVDLARGGVGMVSPVYFPRGCRVDLEVLPFGGDAVGPMLKASARVRRIVMTDRRPAYLLGLVFQDLSPDQESQLDRLLARISGELDEPAAEGAHVRDR